MLDKLEQDIYGAIATTLENMAFMEVGRELDDAVRHPAEETVVSRLLIHDPVPGEVYLAMPRVLLNRITASIFIVAEEDLTEQAALDMLCELINTFAGLFLNAYLPEDQTYKLGLPERVPGIQKDSPFEIRQWEFQVDNELFSLALAGDGFFE